MKRNLFSFWFILAFLFAASVQIHAQSIEKADKLYELGKYPDAIKAYQKILEKQPEYVEALSHLADSYRRLNQLDEAKQAYAKASTLPNFEPEHLLNYGKVLMSRLEYIKAKDIFKRYAQFNRTEGEHFIESCDFALTGLSSPSVYKVAESNINSAFADYGATLVGNNVIFTSARPAKSNKRSGFFGSTKFDNQVFEAAIDGKGGFAAPILYHTTYKSNFNEGPVSFSGDGKWAAFTRNNFSDGTRQVLDLSAQLSIYIAPIAPNGDWGEAVAYTYNGNGYSTGFPCLNQDGTVLYFASDRPGGSGGYDLYQSKRDAGTERWGAPQNLDNIVNSPGNEVTPYYDGKNLFFASDWHQGFGGLDVFRAELDKSNGWSKVFHLGNGVNSPNDDYGFSYDSKRNMGFFTSNRVGSRGREDIYLVSKQSESK
jgi:tetratricopeptide (TPR) repeat protein